MKKIIVLGAGIFQLPLILKAKELGVYTIACSYYSNDPGMSVANRSYNVSTVDKDIVLAIARKENINGIITIASEVAAPTVAYVAEKLGLPGYTYETAQIIANKYRLRVALNNNSLPGPKFQKVINLKQAIKAYSDLSKTGIVVMKPLAASGSRGVVLLNNEQELIDHFETSKNHSFSEKGVILEEYLDGVEVGGECLIYQGKLVFFAITNKYKNKYLVPTGHSLPSKIKQEIQSKIKNTVNKCINILQLQNGALNFDIMVVNDIPIVIELGGRLGGNCLPTLMQYSTGVDTIKEAINISLGKRPKIKYKLHHKPFGVKILGSHKKGLLKAINTSQIKQLLKSNLVEMQYHKNPGEEVEVFDQGAHNIGYVMVTGKNISEIENMLDKIENNISIELE